MKPRAVHVLLASWGLLPVLHAAGPVFSSRSVFHPVVGRGGMVAAQEELAVRQGIRVLRDGGNAVDAAVTVGFTLAVTFPRAGNLGGGGFMLIHMAEPGETIALDYREVAPASAHRDLFLDEDGSPDPRKSRFSAHAVGVPGTVRGLCHALQTYGTISLERALAPAIRLAQEGFPLSAEEADSLANFRDRFASPAARTVFLRPNGSAYRAGDLLRQPDLANTLEILAEQGPDGFYGGEIGNRLVAGLADWGGRMTLDDLRGYDIVEREPVSLEYRGRKIVSMPPPSSGFVILETLRILEEFPLGEWGQHAARTMHVLAEAMKFGYADRAEYLGDPAFTEVPLGELFAPELGEARAARIRAAGVIPPAEIRAAQISAPEESPETTHFSVMDAQGNAVTATTTLNFSYGTGFMAPGTGFLLNNDMDDFSAKPGTPNAYGLLGGEANAVAGGKRMASSMSPTLVFRDGRPCLATGSPGGSRIISTILQILVNVIDHEMNIAEATSAPRIHHQWLPDELRIESTLSRDTRDRLTAMGYRVAVKNAMGSTQSIFTSDGELFQGASDSRRSGALTLAVEP